MPELTKKEKRHQRHLRIRNKISGTADIPRLSIYISTKHIYVQFIDDESGHTLASASTLDPTLKKQNIGANVQGAETVGKTAAERALAAGINKAKFE